MDSVKKKTGGKRVSKLSSSAQHNRVGIRIERIFPDGKGKDIRILVL